MRDTSRDGWQNRLETHVLTHFEPMWSLLQRVEPLRRVTNRTLVSRAILKIPTRPNPFSTMAPYSSWESLTDRRYDSRHLPATAQDGLPPEEQVADLFTRRGPGVEGEKSPVRCPSLAQWFTAGSLRRAGSPRGDPRRKAPSHELDLTPLSGPHKPITDALRAHEGG